MPPGRPSADLLVGLEAPDDAAVYRLDASTAVVASLDFFTPLVDGAEDFGAIAAANALSDLYAMRARPLFGLNVLAVPAGQLPDEVVAGILQGASMVCEEAGIPIAGGHSIDDPEPKFGLVAIGVVDPDRLWRKSGARPGDALVLGKALGTGVITTGIKRDQAPEDATAEAIRSMRQLNRAAMQVLDEREVHAVTDVTGFGLLGHLLEICRASGVGATLRAGAPRLLEGALGLAAQGCIPGGTHRNRRAAEREVVWDDQVSEPLRVLLCDAQTSGGLLAALPSEVAAETVGALETAGYPAATVGTIEAYTGGARIRVSP